MRTSRNPFFFYWFLNLQICNQLSFLVSFCFPSQTPKFFTIPILPDLLCILRRISLIKTLPWLSRNPSTLLHLFFLPLFLIMSARNNTLLFLELAASASHGFPGFLWSELIVCPYNTLWFLQWKFYDIPTWLKLNSLGYTTYGSNRSDSVYWILISTENTP